MIPTRSSKRKSAICANDCSANEQPIDKAMRSEEQVSSSECAQSIETKCKIGREEEEYFNFLGLPDKTIARVFSYLDIKDRMNARVNKKLTKIEAESTYYLNSMIIEVNDAYVDGDYYVKVNGEWCEYDMIGRIAHNTSIGFLGVKFPAFNNLCHRICTLVNKLKNVTHLHCSFEDEDKENDILTDAFFLDLSEKCEMISLTANGNISTAALFEGFKCMPKSSLHYLHISKMNKTTLDSFLRRIGITYSEGDVFSSRDCELYTNASAHVIVFDGLCEIRFSVVDENEEEEEEDLPFLSFKLRQNLKSVEKTKQRLVKFGAAREPSAEP